MMDTTLGKLTQQVSEEMRANRCWLMVMDIIGTRAVAH